MMQVSDTAYPYYYQPKSDIQKQLRENAVRGFWTQYKKQNRKK